MIYRGRREYKEERRNDRGSEEACVENTADSWRKALSLW